MDLPAAQPPGAKTTASTSSVKSTGSSGGTPTGSDWQGWLDGPKDSKDWTTLIQGWSANRTITVGIYTGPTATTSTREQVSKLDNQTIANVQAIFQEIGRYLGVTFDVQLLPSLTGVNQPVIRVFRSNMGGGNSYAYAYYPDPLDFGGDIHLSSAYDLVGSNTNYFTNGRGSHGWQTIYHEIGHALGLAHSFDSGTPVPYDNWNYTVMTYTFSGGEPITYMPGDLARLQAVYGHNITGGNPGNVGDTTYVFRDIDGYDDGLNWYGTGGIPSGVTRFANVSGSAADYATTTQNLLYDSGGTDTLDLTNLTRSVRVALDTIGGTGSIVYKVNYLDTSYRNNGITGRLSSTGTFLDYGTIIERVVGTPFSDEFYGSSNTEWLDGGSDADVVYYQSMISTDLKPGAVLADGFIPLYSNVGGVLGGIVDYVKNVESFVFSNGIFSLSASNVSGWA